jgi:carboxylesterase type B
VPFQQAIYQSQALEAGMLGDCTAIQMQMVVNATGCSDDTIDCLRSLDTQTLAEKSFETYSAAKAAGEGDCWLPVVDGDFLPDAPSKLIADGRFADVATMIMWSEDDTNLYADPTIQTEDDTHAFLADFLPGFDTKSLSEMLALYPAAEFKSNEEANLTAEFYRTGRILRDLVMVCPPMRYGQHLQEAGNAVYYIAHNQTLLSPIFAAIGLPGLGVVHTSETPYIFGNFSAFNQSGLPFNPTAEDGRLQVRDCSLRGHC